MFSSCSAEGEWCDSDPRGSSQLKEPDSAQGFGRIGHMEYVKQNLRVHSSYSFTVCIKAALDYAPA